MDNVDCAAAGSQLRLLFEAGTVTGVSDGHLLEMFVARRDELAFTALVERHGPMVQRVCHAVLGDHHDAQDAFQATFLVLARSARSIRQCDSLASWLYGVALRVAAGPVPPGRGGARMRGTGPPCAPSRRRATRRARTTSRRSCTKRSAGFPSGSAPVVLCYLEGRTYEEAAQVLRCPVGTIKSRLSTARERLRRRLEHRDQAMSSGSVSLGSREASP